MTLHHRRYGRAKMASADARTSSRQSNYSQLKQIPSKAKLVRGARSSSLSFLKAERESTRSPPTIKTEEEVRKKLEDLAGEIKEITCVAQRDKAKTKWVKEW
jgi:hypothetical protein